MTDFYVNCNDKAQWHCGSASILLQLPTESYLITLRITKLAISSGEITAMDRTTTDCTRAAKV